MPARQTEYRSSVRNPAGEPTTPDVSEHLYTKRLIMSTGVIRTVPDARAHSAILSAGMVAREGPFPRQRLGRMKGTVAYIGMFG